MVGPGRRLGRRGRRGRRPLPAAGRPALRPRAAAGLGAGRRTRTAVPCWSPRARPRWSWTGASTSRTRRTADAGGAVRRGGPGGRRGRPRRPRASRRRAAADEHGPDARRVPDLRRPPEGRRRRRPSPSSSGSGSRSRSSPATTAWWPPRCARTSASTAPGVLSGAELEALDDDQLEAAIADDDGLRPDQPRPEVADHQGGAPHRQGRGVPRRRGQRRRGPAPRRRRDLGGLGDRRGQGRRRRRAARQGPRGAGRRRHGGPAHLRQHHEVRPDGHVVELRQHVQRRRRLGVPVLPARCCRRRSSSTTCSTTPDSWSSRPTGSTPRRWPGRRRGT